MRFLDFGLGIRARAGQTSESDDWDLEHPAGFDAESLSGVDDEKQASNEI
jgi:hypothetical protein